MRQALSPFTQIKILEFIQSRKYIELIYAPGSGRLCRALGTIFLCSARAVVGEVSGEGEPGAEGENCSLAIGELGCRAARALGPDCGLWALLCLETEHLKSDPIYSRWEQKILTARSAWRQPWSAFQKKPPFRASLRSKAGQQVNIFYVIAAIRRWHWSVKKHFSPLAGGTPVQWELLRPTPHYWK